MSSPNPVIADSSTLLAFAAISRLDLLAAVFPAVRIPPAVEREIAVSRSAPIQLMLHQLNEGAWMERIEISPEARVLAARYVRTVDAGESEVIALGKRLNLLVLIDDLAARRLAATEGLAVVGSLGILSACKREGIIERVKPVAQQMHIAGRFFSPALLREFFRQEGEE
jgi:uncharacterized protein